jgi:DNA modification methylase
MSSATLYRGDCLAVLASMAPESVDAIVCDPPYGLGFMGKAWDALPPGEDWARACLRVLKPGGHLVAFGGTRTVHRLACAIEDAGLEIRDTIAWVQWQGFPKSLNLPGGLGTGLKPAHEPAILARKPIVGTVAANVLQHGTGALNIDGCRYAYGDPAWPGPGDDHSHEWQRHQSTSAAVVPIVGQEHIDLRGYTPAAGRWPANLYACPKPSRAEREAGCERLPGRTGAEATDRTEGTAGLDSPRAGAGRTADRVKNHHPTVKPLGVMRWLCKLVGGQRGSVILDPFMGSGTTGAAAMLEGFDFIGIEREPEYIQIADARIRHHLGALFAHGVQVIETDEGAA